MVRLVRLPRSARGGILADGRYPRNGVKRETHWTDTIYLLISFSFSRKSSRINTSIPSTLFKSGSFVKYLNEHRSYDIQVFRVLFDEVYEGGSIYANL